MFLSGLGVSASAVTAKILVDTKQVVLTKKDEVSGALWYKRVLPVGLAHAATLAFGNAVYLYLNIGFIQMLKSFTPVILLLTSYLAGVEQPSEAVIFSVLVISLGTAATCSYTPEFSIVGIFIMFLSELSEALRLTLTQFVLQNLKFGVVEGMYVLAPASAFWLFLASACFEMSSMVKNGAFTIFFDHIFLFLIAAFLGICVNFIAYLVIGYTSSLTMKVLGSVRSIILIIIGILFYGEVVVLNEAIGYSIALFGFAGYNAAKMGYLSHFHPFRTIFGAVKKEISSVQKDEESQVGLIQQPIGNSRATSDIDGGSTSSSTISSVKSYENIRERESRSPHFMGGLRV